MRDSVSPGRTEKVTAPLMGTVPRLLIPALAVFCFLILPLAALLWRALPGLFGGGGRPMVADALRLSLLTTVATTLISVLVGTPTAYLLARHRFRGQVILETVAG